MGWSPMLNHVVKAGRTLASSLSLSLLLNCGFLLQDLLNHEALTLADRPQMNLCFLKLFFVTYLFPQYQEK